MVSPAPSPQDLLLLSAYLDGQLSASARAALDERLAADPTLRAVLDDLQATRAVLRAAPTLPPPRDFTLDPAIYGRPAPFWARGGLFRVVGLAGAAAAAALIAFGVLFSGNGAAAPGNIVRNMGTVTAGAAVGIAAAPTQTAAQTETPSIAALSAPMATPPATEPPAADAARSAPAQTAVLEMAPTNEAETGPAAGMMAATAAPLGTAAPAPMIVAATATFAGTVAAKAPEPTQADTIQNVPPTTPPAAEPFVEEAAINPASRLIAVIGISLLLLSGVVFLIGWFRARQK